MIRAPSPDSTDTSSDNAILCAVSSRRTFPIVPTTKALPPAISSAKKPVKPARMDLARHGPAAHTRTGVLPLRLFRCRPRGERDRLRRPGSNHRDTNQRLRAGPEVGIRCHAYRGRADRSHRGHETRQAVR